MTPRLRRTLTAVATAIVVVAVLIAGYFAYYGAVVLPEVRQLAEQISVAPVDRSMAEADLVPPPTVDEDGGPLFERAVGLVAGRDAFDVDELVAIARHRKVARPAVRVDLPALEVLRRAGVCRSADLPGDPLRRLRRRAGLAPDAARAGPLDRLTRLATALVGAAEVHLVADRRDQARADFQTAYHVGRHLSLGAGDVETLDESVRIRRTACSGLLRLAETESPDDADLIRRLRSHLRRLTNVGNRIEDKWLLVRGTSAVQVGAAAKVAREDPEPLWRREATVGLIHLSRLGASSSRYAWLIRGRARAALEGLVDDRDEIVAALATSATED